MQVGAGINPKQCNGIGLRNGYDGRSGLLGGALVRPRQGG